LFENKIKKKLESILDEIDFEAELIPCDWWQGKVAYYKYKG